MPRILLKQLLCACVFAVVAIGPGHASEKRASVTGFDFSRDTFAFQNETYFSYDAQQRPTSLGRKMAPGLTAYSRQCFTMARATVQFYKFARFDPAARKVSEEELACRIRKVCRISTWLSPLPASERVVFPGYESLRQFSGERPALLQRNMGRWWAGYFRFGNYRMPLPFPRAGQAKAAREIESTLRKGTLQIVYMMRFAWLNHNIVLYDFRKAPNGDIEYLAYDPNLNDKPRVLTFRTDRSGFEFPTTFYFRGGPVNVFRTYISPFH